LKPPVQNTAANNIELNNLGNETDSAAQAIVGRPYVIQRILFVVAKPI